MPSRQTTHGILVQCNFDVVRQYGEKVNDAEECFEASLVHLRSR
jgi:hypothetical protein